MAQLIGTTHRVTFKKCSRCLQLVKEQSMDFTYLYVSMRMCKRVNVAKKVKIHNIKFFSEYKGESNNDEKVMQNYDINKILY